MKLARPDVRHPRVVLAGSARAAEGHCDDAGLVGALRKRGLHAQWMSWDDPATLTADLVVLRATRDYPDRLDEFLAWTKHVPNLLNAPDVIAWNVNNRYLAALERAGVPTSAPGAATTALVFSAVCSRMRLPKSALSNQISSCGRWGMPRCGPWPTRSASRRKSCSMPAPT